VTASSNILLTYDTFGGTPGILSAPVATIEAGVGFTITSSSNIDTSIVNWTIVQLSPNLTQGTATLVAGTVTVATTEVAADSVILLTYNTLNTPSTRLRVTAIVAGDSFTLSVLANTDVSTVNWQIFPAQFFLPAFMSPLGILVAADQTSPPTATTGDVRGLYGPSTAADGSSRLRVTSYVGGADMWTNQVANAQFIATANNQPVVGVDANYLTAADLYGLPQYYTGSPS
jgi:hypothetical protein